eukprot:8050614-Pyramimonas_sp.AAC.1
MRSERNLSGSSLLLIARSSSACRATAHACAVRQAASAPAVRAGGAERGPKTNRNTADGPDQTRDGGRIKNKLRHDRRTRPDPR